MDTNPEVGQTWYSPRIGYRVKIVAIGADRKIVVSDGQRKHSIPLVEFLNPENRWGRLNA